MLRSQAKLIGALHKRAKRKCVAALVGAATAACTASHLFAQQVEIPIEFRASGQNLVFRVNTHGCTHKSDFVVDIEPNQTSSDIIVVTLVRLHPDRCKGLFREGKEINFTRQELRLPPRVTITISESK
jgi:hypothetical protein